MLSNLKMTISTTFRAAMPADLPLLTDMVASLYSEDPSPQNPGPEHTRRTFLEFEQHPEKGGIRLFEYEGAVIGYAILVRFWSNEYGGDKIIVDELFVLPDYRGSGISTAFFKELEANSDPRSVALELEVTPGNAPARRLYERLGFRKAKNDYFVKRIRHGT